MDAADPSAQGAAEVVGRRWEREAADPSAAGEAGPDERQTSCELLLFCLIEFKMRALLSGECSTIKTTFLLHVGTFPALTCFQNRCEFFARAPAPLLKEEKMSSLLMWANPKGP